MRAITRQGRRELIRGFLWLAGLITLVIGGSLIEAYRGATNRMESLLVTRIGAEFEEPKIKATIQDVAKDRASAVIRSEINPAVAAFKVEIEDKQHESERLLAATRNQLDEFTGLIELEDAARFGDRKAFEKLLEYSRRTDPLGTMAARRIKLISDDLEVYFTPPAMWEGVQFHGADGHVLKSSEIPASALFESLADPKTKKSMVPGILHLFDGKSKDEICTAAASVLRNSNSLPACAAACGVLDRTIGHKAQPLDFALWRKACEAFILSP